MPAIEDMQGGVQDQPVHEASVGERNDGVVVAGHDQRVGCASIGRNGRLVQPA